MHNPVKCLAKIQVDSTMLAEIECYIWLRIEAAGLLICHIKLKLNCLAMWSRKCDKGYNFIVDTYV